MVVIREWTLRLLRMAEKIREKINGNRCWDCGEKYAGLAMDCICTNWGKP